MDKKTVENYKKAGQILQETQKKAKKYIKPGQKMLEIAEFIEKTILTIGGKGDKKAKPAFPVNLSANEQAAHYTPGAEDETVLGENDLLKVDIGVQLNGFIADAAFSLDFSGKQGKLVEASEKALEKAVALVKEKSTKTSLKEIGILIEETIKGFGFNPIQNLSGHGLSQWNAHSSPTIPNISTNDSRTLQDNTVFAIEPFASTGRGFVKETPYTEIFQLDEPKPVRNMHARKILDFVLEEYKTLPFAERWLQKELKLSEFQRKTAMRELLQKKCIRSFPILKEENNCLVSQKETSILINDGEVIVLV